MSTGSTKQTATELSILLEKEFSAAPVNVKAQSIEKALMSGIDKFQASLPDNLKPEAERFIRRAIIYYQTAEPKQKLHEATPVSFMMAVLEAAEIGLPLDGRLCYAIVYNNKKIDANGKEFYVNEAQCMPDYKGLVAVAKRTGAIKDIYAEIVCEKDRFDFERTESIDRMSHSYPLLGDRGNVMGCYAKVQLPSRDWRFEIMRRQDIDAIRGKSKAANNGPWKNEESSDWKEMAKKAVIKRILKGFMDDPGLSRAIELDDRATGYLPEHMEVQDTRSKTERLTERFAGSLDDRRQTTPTAAREDVHPDYAGVPSSEASETRQNASQELPGEVSDLIGKINRAKSVSAVQALLEEWDTIMETYGGSTNHVADAFARAETRLK